MNKVNMKPKMFIFLSGPEGVGKTTQQKLVHDALLSHFLKTPYYGHIAHKTSFRRQMFKYIISHPETPKELLFYAHSIAHAKVNFASKVNKWQMADALAESPYFQKQEWKNIPMRKLFQEALRIPNFDIENKLLDLSPRQFMIHMSEHRAKVLKGKDIFARMLVEECEHMFKLTEDIDHLPRDIFVCDTLAFSEEFDYIFEHTPHHIYQIYMEFLNSKKNGYEGDSRIRIGYDFFQGIHEQNKNAPDKLKRIHYRNIVRGSITTETDVRDSILDGLVPAVESFIHRHEK